MALPVSVPDLSDRPFGLEVSRLMAASPKALYRAWTEQFDAWFAAPGSVLMEPRVNAPFFFETIYRIENGQPMTRHPHYGRFLRLDPGRLVEMTWVTGKEGTRGAETVVTVCFSPQESGTELRLSHVGFLTREAAQQHEVAWPLVLEKLDHVLAGRAAPPEHTIILTRVFAASPEAIYAAFTKPALMRRWMAEKLEYFEADVRVGGRYRIENRMEGQVFVHVGEYLALEPGRRVVQSFRAGPAEQDPKVPSPYLNEFFEVKLRPLEAGRTELTLTNGWDGEALDNEASEGVREGWSQWLGQLEAALRFETDKGASQ